LFCFVLGSQWDPKITTLPGLYIVSYGILNPLSWFFDRLFCDATHLRLINVAMAAVTLPILFNITRQIHGNKHVSLSQAKLLVKKQPLFEIKKMS
jgi:alpha-1,2-glucosyltransferase